MTFFVSHRQFDADHPLDAQYARDRAACREAKGLPAGRAFPCVGNLHIVGRIGAKVILECDSCDFDVTVNDQGGSHEQDV